MVLAKIGQINFEHLPTLGSRSIDCFEKLELIGEGTYGQVYMARERKTGEIVALKRIRMENAREGFPVTSIREICILRNLNHKNVIKLKEIVTSSGHHKEIPGGNLLEHEIFMVFEYMESDLTSLTKCPGLRFSVPEIKCYMWQFLSGLHYCHSQNVLHRDLKGSNLLINKEGTLKIADFGLARKLLPQHCKNLTNQVVTLWYRPPELLLGSTVYDQAVDMWSAGCIFGEFLLGMPIFKGNDEIDQLKKIFELCGSPDEFNWPDACKMPLYNHFKPLKHLRRRIRENFFYFDHHAVELLDNLLALNPKERWTARQALDAEYFWSDPPPADPKSVSEYNQWRVSLSKKRKLSEMEEARQITTHPPVLLFPPLPSTRSQHLANQATSAQPPTYHNSRGVAPNTRAGPHRTIPYANNGYGCGRDTQFRGPCQR